MLLGVLVGMCYTLLKTRLKDLFGTERLGRFFLLTYSLASVSLLVSNQLHLLYSSLRKEPIIDERTAEPAAQLFLSSIAQWHRDSWRVYAQSQFDYPWFSAGCSDHQRT